MKHRKHVKAIDREMSCSQCGKVLKGYMPSEDATSVIGWCCTVHWGPQTTARKEIERSHHPRGWKFMNEYVDKEGNVYHKGELRPDLKGTLEPTIIEAKPKLTRRERELKKLEREKKLAARHERKMEKLKKLEKKKEREQNKFFE